ncbi:MAG: efflux RND transporter periplasmic adaptor subunit [Acidobacteriia bacterium]|nr:efflux RND transporter periplasmic adaptor subunit [Terriglobia bacterium]
MKMRIIYASVLLITGGAAVAAVIHGRTATRPAPPAAVSGAPGNAVICAAGKVEPVSEVIKIGSELAGVLREVTVEEGQHLRHGQVIAVLANAEYEARVREAAATIAIRQAELERIVNGARDQERREAAAAVEEAEAVLANARAEMARRQSLFQTGDVSRSDWERTEREYQVAEARLGQAMQRHALVDAPARADERARAEAGLALARAQLTEAEALLEKTVVRAPFDGSVLRRFRKAGETVSDRGDTPIVSFGDDSRLRVRVDVDETDVARLRPGDRAYFTAQAFGPQKFWGRVVSVGRELGKKNVPTDEPSEKLDTKVLETLVELDGHPPLPLGLRVDSFIIAGGGK